MTPNIDVAERMYVIGRRMQSGQDTYAGRLDAWHKLGHVAGKFSTWQEINIAAGTNFEVAKMQLQYAGRKVDQWGVFRLDDQPVKGLEDKQIYITSAMTGVSKYVTYLGACGENYGVIQHTEGFELMDRLVGSIDGAHYETMGTLDYGGKVWGQVDPNIQIRVGDDVSDILLSFLTSHDGSAAFDIYETAIRQVCRNTVRAGSLRRLAASLRVKHTKNASKRIADLKMEIAEIQSVAMTMQERLNFLAAKKVTRESISTIMDRLFPKKEVEDGKMESSTRRDNILADILAIYDDNDNNQFPEQRGTAYNLLNAITNYTDHSRTARNGGRSESALFGSGDKLKNQAMEIITLAAREMPGNIGRGQSYQVDSFADLGLNVVGGK